MTGSIFLFLALLGCKSKIKDLYEEERINVFATPSPMEADWKPDMRLRIRYDTIQEMGKTNLQQTIGKGKFEKSALGMTLSIHTNNTVHSFGIHDAPGPERFFFHADVTGKVFWKSKKMDCYYLLI